MREHRDDPFFLCPLHIYLGCATNPRHTRTQKSCNAIPLSSTCRSDTQRNLWFALHPLVRVQSRPVEKDADVPRTLDNVVVKASDRITAPRLSVVVRRNVIPFFNLSHFPSVALCVLGFSLHPCLSLSVPLSVTLPALNISGAHL